MATVPAMTTPGPAVTRWEYLTAPLLIHNTKAILDSWGVDGWELVTVLPGPGRTVTSSHPSTPQESRIALVLWINSGMVAYSQVRRAGALMTATLAQPEEAGVGCHS